MLDVLKAEDQNQVNPYRFKAPIENNTDLSMEIKNFREKEQLLRPLVKWLTDQQQSGFATLAVCRTQSQAARLDSLLIPYGLQVTAVKEFGKSSITRGKFSICIGQVSSGFIWPEEKLAIITDTEIFGVRHHRRKSPNPDPVPSYLTCRN
jgi:transcription-repair coupling factor (superfamily II helicase)